MPKIIDIDRENSRNSINWEVWDKIVARTRREIEDALKGYKQPQRGEPCFGYNANGDEVFKWDKIKDCVAHFNNKTTTVNSYTRKQWIMNSVLLSRKRLNKDEAIALYRDRLQHGKMFREKSTKMTVNVYSYNQDGKMTGIYESHKQWAKIAYNGVYKGQLSHGDIIHNDKLVSRNFYGQDTAKEIFLRLKFGHSK